MGVVTMTDMLHSALEFWSRTVAQRPHPLTHVLIATVAIALTAILTITAALPAWAGSLVGGITGGVLFLEIYALGFLAHTANRQPFARWWALRATLTLPRRRWIATWAALSWFAVLVITQPSANNPLLGMATVTTVLSLWTFATAREDENDTQWASLDAATRKLRGRKEPQPDEPADEK